MFILPLQVQFFYMKKETKRILIVEDQLIIGLDIRLMLESLGYQITGIVGSGEECIESVRQEKPDLVLMDIMLSGEIDGIFTAELINREFDVPIIYLTAHSDENSLVRANLTEPYGYIVKPIDEKYLYSAIEIALHRFKLDRELKKSEIKYRTLFEQSLDPIFICDDREIIIDANQAMIDLFGYSLDSIIGNRVEFLFEKGQDYTTFMKEVREKSAMSNFGTRLVCSNNRTIDVQITLKSWDHDRLRGGYQGIIRDITQYKLYFEELLYSRQELRNLTAHVESLREKERTDIAREIHDVLGQHLTALRLDLSWIRKRLKPEDAEFIEKTSAMDGIINEIIMTVRRLSSSLRPGILDDLGLSAAIEWQAEEFRKRTGYECSVSCDEIGELPEDKSVALFRIFQESLTNIIKHAGASRVLISLEKKAGQIEMVISDNGKGLCSDDLRIKGSYGIIGMRERVKLFNGTLSIDGKEGAGTTVKVQFPHNE